MLGGRGTLGRVSREGTGGRSRSASDMDVGLLVAQMIGPDSRGNKASGDGRVNTVVKGGMCNGWELPFCGQDR